MDQNHRCKEIRKTTSATDDTLACIIRTLGKFALPTAAINSDQFRRDCEQFARELLVGEKASPTAHKKLLSTIITRIRAQRQSESSEYKKHRESAHIIVADLVTRLRKSLEERQSQDDGVIEALQQMEQAVSQGDLSHIRLVCSKAVHRIRDVITVQRQRDKEQLADLSNQLYAMRAELTETQAKMQRDPLTELFNRGAFDESFEQTVEIANADATELTLFMLDLDFFKKVNDHYGHPAGDEVLRRVGRQLIRCFPRKDDMVVRFGGEEFAIICRHTGATDAPMLGERVRKQISALSIDLDGVTYHQTVSVGYAVKRSGESARNLLDRADNALYQAKKNGRNQVIGAT